MYSTMLALGSANQLKCPKTNQKTILTSYNPSQLIMLQHKKGHSAATFSAAKRRCFLSVAKSGSAAVLEAITQPLLQIGQ